MFVPFDLWSHFFAELRRWFLFFYRLGENGRAFLSTAGRCLLYSLLLEIPFRFFFFFYFIRFRYNFLSTRFFLLVDIYIQILSTILKTRQDEIKNTSPSRFSAVSRYILDRYYIVSGSDWKSPFFRRFQRLTDRPTDRPPDQIDFTVSGNGSVDIPREDTHHRTRSLPYRVSVGVISTRAARALRASTGDAQSVAMRAQHVRRMRVACKFEIDIYRSTHIYIYQLSSIIVTILLRIIICTNFMLRYKINDKTTMSPLLLLSETRSPTRLDRNLPSGIIKR